MSVEIGHFLLVCAALIAFLQVVIPFIGVKKAWSNWAASALPLAVMQFVLVFFSFTILIRAFMRSDFSLRLVALNSHSTKPMLYKIAGTWGNHEGSMLMWVTILALFGALAAIFSKHLPLVTRALVLSVQGLVGLAFYLFVLLTSNPFLRLVNPPMDGEGLNPILQDPGLAFHPPFLYLGYVGLSVSFSFAIAGLIEGRIDAAWARFVRPWALAAWIFLTIGIALGSWWAYYELGWGGFWFWDPVENASFMPWLMSVALLHSAIVVEKRDSLKNWTVLLAIIAFSFSLVGTFIVRSGVLTSVHSFASDPARGVFILAILGVTICGGLALYAWRAPHIRPGSSFMLISRENGIVLNNLFLSVATGVVFFGTIWPLIAEMLFDDKLSVGAPFFNQSFTPFMVMLALILPIGAMLPWKRARLSSLPKSLWFAFLFALVVGIFGYFIASHKSLLVPLALILGAWIIFGAIVDLFQRSGGKSAAMSTRIQRLRGMPLADWGKIIAHTGFAVVILGVGLVNALMEENIHVAEPGNVYDFAGFTFAYDEFVTGNGPNYRYERGVFSVKDGDDVLMTLTPETRFFNVEGQQTTEAAIQGYRLGDIYLVMRKTPSGDGYGVYTYKKPYVHLLWYGAALFVLGGLVSLFDRRMRVAAPARKVVKSESKAHA